MTLSTIFKSVFTPATSSFGQTNKFLLQRNSDYSHYGSHKHHKSKSDKKHAILSALTLLAFLFFLNILQNCIREQYANRGTVMMFPSTGQTAPTGHEAKDPNEDLKSPPNPIRKKRDIDPEFRRQSRTLLGFEENKRQIKFIRNFNTVNNWTRELSPMTDKDLKEQKLKTSNLYWNRFSTELQQKNHSMRKFKKRERTTTENATTWDYKKFQPSPYIPERVNRTNTTTPHMTINTPTTQTNYIATTPRYRRSDYSTPRDYEDYGEQTAPTPAIGLDLNTYQTFPVYNYYNHRPYRENQTVEEPTTPEIDRMHNEVRVTTQQPLFHPTKTTKPFKYKNRYHDHPHYHVRTHYPLETRYRYSPYRKTGVYEPPHFHDHVHDDYYPPVVLAKYEVQHDEPGFDLMKFLWAMVTSFARPLTKLVPSFAKDNHEEAQCYDLLVCEAQRVSRFMGPTAEALATTVGTLLTWAATEETRQIVVDAINSGRENTCQQQIRDCEDRSGGKSAMTVIAQVMEMKLR